MKQEYFDPAVHITLNDLAGRTARDSTRNRRLQDLMRLFLVGHKGKYLLPVLTLDHSGRVSTYDREIHYRLYHTSQMFMPHEVRMAGEHPPSGKSELWRHMAGVDPAKYPGDLIASCFVVRIADVRDFIRDAHGPDWLAIGVGESVVGQGNASDEADCRKWLRDLFKTSGTSKMLLKNDLHVQAQREFPSLSGRAFARAWAAEAPQRMKEPGHRPRLR